MKHKIRALRTSGFLLLIFIVSCQTSRVREGPLETAALQSVRSELPTRIRPTSEVILDHDIFQISYNQDHRLPNWVFYRLSAIKLSNPSARRRDDFMADPLLIKKGIPFLLPTAFAGSGYDRGHMAPSADFEWDQTANDATFVMSNMAPQQPHLNRRAWKYLETRIRKWACTEGELKIVTGPILQDGLSKLPSGVSVPTQFFKAILDNTPPRKSVGFIYSQKDSSDLYKSRARTVAEVERAVGFNFFSEVEESEQTKIESIFELSDWVEGKCERH